MKSFWVVPTSNSGRQHHQQMLSKRINICNIIYIQYDLTKHPLLYCGGRFLQTKLNITSSFTISLLWRLFYWEREVSVLLLLNRWLKSKYNSENSRQSGSGGKWLILNAAIKLHVKHQILERLPKIIKLFFNRTLIYINLVNFWEFNPNKSQLWF